jgi:ribosome-associated heat shock protein Hsp15
MASEADDTPVGSVRLDKWVWTARFFKTRQLAIEAINAGRIDVNGERAKPSKAIRAGDTLLLRKPPYAFHLSVRAVGEKRVSATLAKSLYDETPESIAAREALVKELREMPPPVFKGRPTKQDRRALEKLHQSMQQSIADDE